MKKLFKLTEKDLEMISGGAISETIDNIISGVILGLPVGAPIAIYSVDKGDDTDTNTRTHMIVACGVSTVVSSVGLIGIGAGAGAGLLKAGQVLYSRFKNKKTKQRV